MNTAVFSISTNNYIKNADVSLRSFVRNSTSNIDIYNITIDDIINKKYADIQIQKFVEKYNKDTDKLRWSLKPVFLRYFLSQSQKKYSKAIYIDNDLYFINNIDFLLEDIEYGIVLTKHNRPIYPSQNRLINQQFLSNFTDGFFNGGFIGASQKGIKALNWWSSMTYWQCCKAKSYGLYDDQKYLDTMALEFERCIKICEHPGCNLATWNTQSIKRSKINNTWLINDKFDPIFFHFSCMSIYNQNFDPMLYEFYEKYKNEINNAT